MKKAMLLMSVILVFTMTGCTQPTSDPLACEDGEMLIGEDCMVISGPELQLYNAINNTKKIVGYDMEVSISNELELVELSIVVDINMTSISIGNDRTFTYTSTDGICDVVEVYLDTEITYTEDCNETEKYSFFRELDYSWFVLESGKYNLEEEQYETVEGLFDGFLASAEIIDFQTSIEAGYISEVLLVIEIDSIEYDVEMRISNPAFISFTQVSGGE